MGVIRVVFSGVIRVVFSAFQSTRRAVSISSKKFPILMAAV